MSETLWTACSAMGLGLLLAIHPCPLSSHLSALALLGGWSEQPRRVWFAGWALALGMAGTYAALGALLGLGLAGAVETAAVLQTYLLKLLGPFLVLAGMLMLGLLETTRLAVLRERLTRELKRRSCPTWTAFPIGMLLALCFCPASAALFFGVLMPLALTHPVPVLWPLFFGAGVAIPLVLAAGLAAHGARCLGKHTDPQTRLRRIRLVAGTFLILAGIRHALQHVYGVALS